MVGRMLDEGWPGAASAPEGEEEEEHGVGKGVRRRPQTEQMICLASPRSTLGAPRPLPTHRLPAGGAGCSSTPSRRPTLAGRPRRRSQTGRAAHGLLQRRSGGTLLSQRVDECMNRRAYSRAGGGCRPPLV